MVVLDHITKLLVIENIKLHSEIPIIPGFFNLVYVQNTGAAWGMFNKYPWILLGISIVVFIAILYFFRYLAEGWQERYYALALIISGIIGNSLDRVFRKAVVDFLDFFIGSYRWPAFNVADSAITVGVAIMIISNLLRPQAKKSEETAKEPAVDSNGH